MLMASTRVRCPTTSSPYHPREGSRYGVWREHRVASRRMPDSSASHDREFGASGVPRALGRATPAGWMRSTGAERTGVRGIHVFTDGAVTGAPGTGKLALSSADREGK